MERLSHASIETHVQERRRQVLLKCSFVTHFVPATMRATCVGYKWVGSSLSPRVSEKQENLYDDGLLDKFCATFSPGGCGHFLVPCSLVPKHASHFLFGYISLYKEVISNACFLKFNVDGGKFSSRVNFINMA